MENFEFLRVYFTAGFTWSGNISHRVKKAKQRLLFNFYCVTVEKTPKLLPHTAAAGGEGGEGGSACLWGYSAQPPLEDIYASRQQKKDPTRPERCLLAFVPSERRRHRTEEGD